MSPDWTTMMAHWLAAVAPALPFVMLYVAYRRILKGKHLTVEQVMSRPSVLDSYVKAFARAGASESKTAGPKDVVQELFDLYYYWGGYAYALLLITITTVGVTACILVNRSVELGLSPALNDLAKKTLPTVAFGFAGAYLWSLFDLLRRYRSVDLTPAAFHFCWLRMLVASVVGPLVALAGTQGIQNIVAFGFGILPLQTMFQYFSDYASKRLGLGANQVPAAAPTLHFLQGMTADSIERMDEVRIDSTATLSYSDPMKLFLRTDIEWVVIIDVMDQALLFNYIGEKLVDLRPIGIRGSIELAIIYQRLQSAKTEEVNAANALVAALAPKLGLSVPETLNLIRTVWEDGQVILLWDLFGESFAGEDSSKRAKGAGGNA